jgi:ribonuclease HI
MSAKASTSFEPPHALIFSDGACSKNPGPGGWGVVAYFPNTREVIELGGAAATTTNNLMELESACQALELCESLKEPGPVTLCSDSKYVIQGITQWIHGWQKNGFKKSDGNDVLNQASWKRLYALALKFKGRLSWRYVPGHSDVPGNERADRIAVGFSVGPTPTLYRGPLDNYTVDLFRAWDAPMGETKKPQASSTKKKSAKGGYYLSLVEGRLERHETWNECERRVKGQSNARFKKVTSSEEEQQVLRSWGLP